MEEGDDSQERLNQMTKGVRGKMTGCCDDSPIVLAPPPVLSGPFPDYLTNGIWESSGCNGTVMMEQGPPPIPPPIQNSVQLKTPIPMEQHTAPPSFQATERQLHLQRHQIAPGNDQEFKKKPSENSRSRTSSYEFRQKQKMYIQNLEQRVGELTTANAELQSRMHLLVSENNIIKEHLRYLRSFVSQAVSEIQLPGSFPPGQTSSSAPDGERLIAPSVLCSESGVSDGSTHQQHNQDQQQQNQSQQQLSGQQQEQQPCNSQNNPFFVKD